MLQALTCFPLQPEESPDNQLAMRIFPYFLFISAFFLIATFVVYAILPEFRNILGLTIMCFLASMAAMNIGLGIIQINPFVLAESAGLCVGLGQFLDLLLIKSHFRMLMFLNCTAVMAHFTYLSTFSWLNVMSFDVFFKFRLFNYYDYHDFFIFKMNFYTGNCV